MALTIESNGESEEIPSSVSLQTVNRKLESFIEVLMAKLLQIQKESSSLKKRIAALEKNSHNG